MQFVTYEFERLSLNRSNAPSIVLAAERSRCQVRSGPVVSNQRKEPVARINVFGRRELRLNAPRDRKKSKTITRLAGKLVAMSKSKFGFNHLKVCEPFGLEFRVLFS